MALGHDHEKEKAVILESLIRDDTILTLDCARATIRQGVRVEIADEFYFEIEVQSAIKLGFIRLVGEPPVMENKAPADALKTFKNVHDTRIAFDCIKGSVGPGEFIKIPESVLEDPEIVRALGYGMLIDPEETAKKPVTAGAPVNIDEVSMLEDEEDAPEKVDLSEVNISEAATSMIVKTIVETYRIMPLTFDGEILTIASANEDSRGVIHDLRVMLNCDVRSVLADEGDIMATIEKHYGAPFVPDVPFVPDLEVFDDETEEELGKPPSSETDSEDDELLEDLFGPEESEESEGPDDAFVRAKTRRPAPPADAPVTRPQPKTAPQAKSISRVGEGDIEGGAADDENALFAPSKVYDPSAKAPTSPKTKDKAKSSEKTDTDDDDDFMNVFGDESG